MFNPRHVSPEMRANTTKTHIFQSFEKAFIDYLKEAGAGPEMIEDFTSETLPKYSYAFIENGKKPRLIKPAKPSPKPKSKPANNPKSSKGVGRRK